ncbi:MAG: hypothetical protein OXG35_22395 [Acidobacteria bacterium]|nr:hypothetical protein [Acidobacteriota bacterium]
MERPEEKLRLHTIGDIEIPEGTTIEGLEPLRRFDAYVLIAPPESGMDRRFAKEAQQTGSRSLHMSCRDFVCFHEHRSKHDESWREAQTYFLHGFEELRADVEGQWLDQDPRIGLDKLRGAIDRVRPARMRLLTTPDMWLGKNDEIHLARVAPGRKLVIATWC